MNPRHLCIALFAGIVLAPGALVATAAPAPTAKALAAPTPAPWPREVKLSNAVILIYQPQVNSWTDNKLDFRCALAILPKGATREDFGVVFATARTRVDKATRRVVLDDLKITKSDFPSLPDHGAAHLAELQARFAQGVRSVSLDQLRQSPALATTSAPAAAVLSNVPKVIVSNTPAILVPIDGPPALRPAANNPAYQRVINTRALILQRTAEKDFFIHVFDGWMTSPSIQGPWSPVFIAPAGLAAAGAKVNAAHVVDMLDGGLAANPRPSLAAGAPTIYTTQVPTELIVFNGAPDFVPIIGTSLLWAANTTSDVLVDTTTKDYFVLLAGRWFRASALNGQWTSVANNALPTDFSRIPPTSLAGAVLPAVAGTPQAQQALNENSIAQTAQVPRRNGPRFMPKFDGAPQFGPIAGTSLKYVINASAPIVKVADDAFYAVRAGVWFTASQVTGPWTVATSVPEAIYAIPPSSPVYFVTYVRIYDVTPDVVHEGYTPGYLGTAVSPYGTLVYGTGFSYMSWIGNVWFPAPSTYGVAAAPVYNQSAGYAYAFAVGLATPAWTAPYLRGAYFSPGYWGGYPCCGTTATNVYRRPNGASVANVRSADVNSAGPVQMTSSGQQYNSAYQNAPRGYDRTPNIPAGGNGAANPSKQWQPYTLPNVYYADPNGNVYRQDNGSWQQNSGGSWGSASGDTAWADQEVNARNSNNTPIAAASYGMSNADRFTGAPNTGWTAQDEGNGGYSRTGGASGGISSEYYNYWNDVQNNASIMWWDGPYYGGTNLWFSGIGWSSRFP
jgi:hypothetical protein